MARSRVILRSVPAERGEPARTERGDTLVEVLVAVVIIGTSVTALLGALLTSTSASVTHRNTTSFASYVASFAETARNTVEFQAYNGSGTGPAFATCATSYQLVGNPIPKSGPPGSSVAVLGTGFPPTGGPNGTFSGTFNASALTTNAINSSVAGDIGQFTVPTLPAGSYRVTPFDNGASAHPTASTFTITPWVSAMTPTGAGRGLGSSVTISSVKGFAATTALKVIIGSNAPINTGATTSATGQASNVTFTIPAGLTGSRLVQLVSVTDGINTSQPEPLTIGADSAPQDPPANPSGFSSFATFTSTVSYWNGASWTTNAASCNANPNIQQLGFSVVDNQPNNGSGANQTILVGNFDPQGVPAPPVTLTASTPTAPPSGEVKLSWFPPAFQGATSVSQYKVYRSTTSGGPWGSPITTVLSSSCTSQCSFTDSALSNGTIYYYEVTATNSVGDSAASNQASGTTVPGTPAGVTATGQFGQVSLSWNAPANGDAPITGYNVYCSTTAGPKGTAVNVAPVTSPYTDTMCNGSALSNGTNYYYEITAVNAGGESQPTAQVSTATLPGAPTGLSGSPGNKQVSLSWTAPANGNAPITGYNVYCSTALGFKGTQVTSTAGTTTTYLDNTCNGAALSNGVPYYYEVTALNASGEGPTSSQIKVTPGTPTAPTSFTATPGSSGNGQNKTYFINLSWSVPSNINGSPVISYNIYRSTTPTMPASPSFNVLVPTTTFKDSTVTHGTIYYYWVTAVNGNGEGLAAMVGPVTA